MDKIMEPLQRLGKALMGAVAVMPLAALMMGIGYWITSVGGEGAVIYGDLLLKTGAAVLDNLGVIFAIALPMDSPETTVVPRPLPGSSALPRWLISLDRKPWRATAA